MCYIFNRRNNDLAVTAGGQGRGCHSSILIKFNIRRNNDLVSLLKGRHVFRLVGHLAVFDLPVRCLNKAVLIHLGKSGQRYDQADVRTFRGFNRTDTTVMCRMNVADLKPGPLSRQTSRPQCAQPSFVCYLGEKIGLVHKLRQLAGAEKFLNGGCNGFRIDQVVRHKGLDLLQAHPFPDGPFHPDKTDPVLILDQLPDSSDPPVA